MLGHLASKQRGREFPPSRLILSVITAAPVAAVAAAPVTTAPAPMAAAPITTMPATAPAPMTAPAAMIPAHLFGLQMFHLVAGGNGGTGILLPPRQRGGPSEPGARQRGRALRRRPRRRRPRPNQR